MVAILRRTPGVRKVVLCGSLVDGQVGVASDIDLVVVQAARGHFFDRSARILRRLRPRTALDLLVYTPSEFDRMTREGNRFLRHALSRGKVLFERGSARGR